MWGDRLIDGKALKMGKWEASENGTAAAISKIPKDIIICPWHYEVRETYPSIEMFLDQGFRILTSSWKDVDATRALIKHAKAQENPNLLGHIFTTWGSVKGGVTAFEPMIVGLEML